MFGSVMVIGALRLICSMKSGITEPRLHMTFPYRVQARTVPPRSNAFCARAWTTFSPTAFVMPMVLIG